MPEEIADDPFGAYTGAGTIFGATGGVTEAAARTAHWLITGKNLSLLLLRGIGAEGALMLPFTLSGSTTSQNPKHINRFCFLGLLTESPEPGK